MELALYDSITCMLRIQKPHLEVAAVLGTLISIYVGAQENSGNGLCVVRNAEKWMTR